MTAWVGGGGVSRPGGQGSKFMCCVRNPRNINIFVWVSGREDRWPVVTEKLLMCQMFMPFLAPKWLESARPRWFQDFFQTTWGGAGGPGRLFFRLFWVVGLEGPRDSCSSSGGSQFLLQRERENCKGGRQTHRKGKHNTSSSLPPSSRLWYVPTLLWQRSYDCP